jgi:hypothetical protein
MPLDWHSNFTNLNRQLDKQVFLILDFLCEELQGKNCVAQVREEMYEHLVLSEG